MSVSRTRLRALSARRTALPLATALVAALAAPAGALAADTQAPEIVSASAAPSLVNVTGSAATVTVTFRATDDTGVVLPGVVGDSDLSRETTAPGEVTRISGDARDGVYTARLTVARGAVGGGWTALAPQLADTAGNVASNVALSEFTVFAFGWDTTPPKLVSSSIAQPTIDVTSAPGSIALTLRVTDDYSGARPPIAQVTSPDGTETTTLGGAVLVSGDANDGVWGIGATVPQNAQRGAWTVTLRPLYDQTGNKTPRATTLGTVTVTSTAPPAPAEPIVPAPAPPAAFAAPAAAPAAPAPGSSAVSSPAPVDQGGVLGLRTTSKSLLTFAAKSRTQKVARKGSLSIALKCTGVVRCRGSVRLYAKVRGKKVKVVSKRVTVPAGKTAKVAFKLTKKGARTVRRGKKIKVTASVWTDGTKAPKNKSLTLRRS